MSLCITMSPKLFKKRNFTETMPKRLKLMLLTWDLRSLAKITTALKDLCQYPRSSKFVKNGSHSFCLDKLQIQKIRSHYLKLRLFNRAPRMVYLQDNQQFLAYISKTNFQVHSPQIKKLGHLWIPIFRLSVRKLKQKWKKKK